jgi:hypothetical protein
MTCPNCAHAMTERMLDGHLGRRVTIDICMECQAFWFDERESLQLSPAATLQLFRLIGEGAHASKTPVSPFCKCPRCGLRLIPAHDLQRTTHFEYRRCPMQHGRFITFFDFLREKDFIRPLSPSQVEDLKRTLQTIHCANCGASIDLRQTSTCAHCGSPLSMLDMQQAASLVQQLRDAAVGATKVDPALPLRLEEARREVSASFANFDQEPTWYRDVAATDLVRAGMSAIARWLGSA